MGKEKIKLDEYSYPFLTENDAIESLLAGIRLNQPVVDPRLQEEYNSASDLLEGELRDIFKHRDQGLCDPNLFHKYNSKKWNIPNEYLRIDIDSHVLSLCKTKEEIERVKYELSLYKKADLFDILKVLLYIVDTFVEHDIVWGVGRGSSVSSYILYLLGVHKVNSIKYNLDIKEFIKE